MASIQLKNITKKFDKVTVIENLNLTIEDGSFTVLVGPSGCGKTTTLRMIAGIETQTNGQILIGDRDVTNIAPGKREVAMVFQNYAIYPTMTVKENIEFGLINKKVPKAEREKLISEICEIVGLTPYLKRKPSALSGGQRQRVALARAMVKKPQVFLMDEPLSNLDAKLRVQMRVELIELHKRLGTTFVYVTHDQVEAMSMGDKIVLMNEGLIQQEASPKEIYRNPNNLFTAQFIGTPPMNILKLNEDYKIGFRPEKVIVSNEGKSFEFNKTGEIVTREMLGSETLYQVMTDMGAIMIKSLEDDFETGEKVYVSVREDDLYFFDKKEQRIGKGDKRHEKCLLFGGGL